MMCFCENSFWFDAGLKVVTILHKYKTTSFAVVNSIPCA